MGTSFEMLAIYSYAPYLVLLGTVIVHLAFSAAVFNDAKHLQKSNFTLAFVGPVIWTLAVLFGGVFVAVAYWLVHHSALSR